MQIHFGDNLLTTPSFTDPSHSQARQDTKEQVKMTQMKRDRIACTSSLPDSGNTDAMKSVITGKDRKYLRKTTFAEKLMDILSSKKFTNAITWFPEGKSFVILKPDKFTKEVLPRFFNETKFANFTHKLYCWGFKCLVGSARNTAFYHDLFLRDQPKLCKQMQSCNIAVDDHDLSKQAKVAMSITSDESDDETASSTMDLSSNKVITTTVANLESNDRDPSLSPSACQDLQGFSKGEDIMNKPWLDEAFLFDNQERAIFRERLNMNSIMNLKPLVIRPAETNNSLNLSSSKKLDGLYHRHILSNYNTTMW